MKNLSDLCADGATTKEEMIAISDRVSLRLITFTPAKKTKNPPVVFVAGWISLIIGWKAVLREMTKDFTVYYIETREKISSKTKGRVEQSVEAIGRDIVDLVSHLGLQANQYILLGSSLGGTALLDGCRYLPVPPTCLVLIEPNAEFRIPKIWRLVIHLFYPGIYLIVRPAIKWYLRNFRLNTEADPGQYQKYCRSLDAADPWKLKKAAMALWDYQVWDLLKDIPFPTLLFSASKDKLHEPKNIEKMMTLMPNATYIDMETNQNTHSPEMVEEMRKYLKRVR